MRLLLVTVALACALACALISPASADELPEPRHSLVQVHQFARYDRFPGEVNAGRVGISARTLIGATLAYNIGLDLDAGASAEGAVYNAELWPLGLGVRIGDSGMIALGGGFGVGGAGGGVLPTAFQVPVELRAHGQLGPVRATAWAVARETPFDDGRDLELEGSLAVGWGRQDRYWRDASAGYGPFVAVTARRLTDDDVSLAISVGLELLGAN